MVYNYLEQYDLIAILAEEGLHSVKTDSKTLQEFSGKFIDITDKLEESADQINNKEDSSDAALLTAFYSFRESIYKLEVKYFSNKNIIESLQDLINQLKTLTKSYSKIIENIKNIDSIENLKKIFNDIIDFNKYIQKNYLDNPSIDKNLKKDLSLILITWQESLNAYFKLKEKLFDKSKDPDIYINFKNGDGFFGDKVSNKNIEYYFYHEELFYNLTIRRQFTQYNNEDVYVISFSAGKYDVSFNEFIESYKDLTLEYKARNLKDTQLFWNKLITIIKHYAQDYNIKYFMFKGAGDDDGKKISSAISENKALKTFQLFNNFLFANVDIKSEIPAQPLIRWLQQYNQDWKYSLKLKIKELKKSFFEFENSVYKRTKAIDTLGYIKIISMIKSDKESFEEEKKILINFFKRYNSIKKKLNNLNIDELKPGPLFKELKDLNEDITMILPLEGKIKKAHKKIENFIDQLTASEKSLKLKKQYNLLTLNAGRFIRVMYSEMFLKSLTEIKISLILTLGFSLIKYAINKERVSISKNTGINKKEIYFKKSKILKKINSIVFNLIEYFKIFSMNQELKDNFNNIFVFIETLSPPSKIKNISKQQFKSILIDTIDTINNKYNFTKKHKDFESRLESYMFNFKNNEKIDVDTLKEQKKFNFSPLQYETTAEYKSILTQPGSLLELTKDGKLALMNARDKRYYKLLASYGITDEDIFFDPSMQIIFRVK